MQSFILRSSISISTASSGKSSLLIPLMSLGYFQSRCNALGGQAAYLSFMVQHFLPYLPALNRDLRQARNLNWNTAYQKCGQDLQKKNFIPDCQDWESLRQAAAGCGVSMCFLFVFLMHLEADGILQKLQKMSILERNSSPDRPRRRKKLGKFSKFERVLMKGELEVHRRLQIA